MFSSIHGLQGQTVEVLAGQNGGGEYSDQTESILSGCLDFLFQSGIIATNDRPRDLGQADFEDNRYGMSSATEGYVDYLLSFLVSYGPSTAMAGRSIPLAMVWRVLRVSDNSVQAGGTLSPGLDIAMDQKKYEAGLRALGSELGRTCLSSLKGVKP